MRGKLSKRKVESGMAGILWVMMMKFFCYWPSKFRLNIFLSLVSSHPFSKHFYAPKFEDAIVLTLVTLSQWLQNKRNHHEWEGVMDYANIHTLILKPISTKQKHPPSTPICISRWGWALSNVVQWKVYIPLVRDGNRWSLYFFLTQAIL